MQTIQVRTTQNVFIHYPLASVGDRILAYLFDRVVVIAFVIAIGTLLYNLDVKNQWVWILLLGFPYLFYSVMFEIFMNGQTLGKHILKIRVIRLNGTPASVGDFVMRWVFAIIDFGVLGGAIALILVAAGGKGQRLGDMVAGTTVIKLVEQQEITADQVFVTAETEYQPVFTQAIQLNERDVELIQRALEVNRDTGNATPVLAVTEKLKTQLGIQTDLPPVKFLYTLIKDFNHITSQ
ncbi:MAG: RDD family protein [Cyclobacteriaceae bacterium]|nr:RDD family protein [Cyclobacteriaceae bacterium]